MQTFLPFADFQRSAESLDRQRLMKQRVECKQIYKALTTGKGWIHHPATLMWRGHEFSLLTYALAMCRETLARGYNDSLFLEFLGERNTLVDNGPPKWLGDEVVHISHRSNLIRKLPSHYRDLLGWTEPDHFDYYWPLP